MKIQAVQKMNLKYFLAVLFHLSHAKLTMLQKDEISGRPFGKLLHQFIITAGAARLHMNVPCYANVLAIVSHHFQKMNVDAH